MSAGVQTAEGRIARLPYNGAGLRLEEYPRLWLSTRTAGGHSRRLRQQRARLAGEGWLTPEELRGIAVALTLRPGDGVRVTFGDFRMAGSGDGELQAALCSVVLLWMGKD